MSSVGVLLQQEPERFARMMQERGWLNEEQYTAYRLGTLPPHIHSGIIILTHDDLEGIKIDLDLLLTRAIQAVVGGQTLALIGYLRLLAEALIADEPHISMKLQGEPVLWENLLKLFSEVVMRSRRETDARTELLELFSLLADSKTGEMKGRLAEAILPDLAQQLGAVVDAAAAPPKDDPEATAKLLRCNRVLVTTIVNFMKKSKPNKDFFCDHVKTVVQVLLGTQDFLLQMQCAELLFRFLKHRKDVLSHVAGLPPALAQGIENLPNDRTLLKEIANLLQRFNKSRELNTIIPFEASSVLFAKKRVCSNATVYFHPDALMVMFPEVSGDNLLIPYTDIRCAKLSKDRSVNIQLQCVGSKLVDILSAELGDDVEAAQKVATEDPILSLFFSSIVLQELKSSPVVGWIQHVRKLVSAKTQQAMMMTSGGVQQQQELAVGAEAARMRSAAQPQEPSMAARTSPRAATKYKVKKGASTSPSAAAVVKKEQTSATTSMKRYHDQPPQMAANAYEDDFAAKAEPEVEVGEVKLEAFAELSRRPRAAQRDNMSPPKKQRQEKPQQQPRPSEILNDVTNSSASTTASTCGADSSMEDTQVTMGKLSALIKGNVHRIREDGNRVLASTMKEIQDVIDEYKRENLRQRDAFEVLHRAEVSKVQKKEMDQKSKLAQEVDVLNSGLHELQAVGNMISDQIGEIDEEDESEIDVEARRAEEQNLQRFKQGVESQLKGMEETMNQYISSVNPMRLLSTFLESNPTGAQF